MSNKNKRQIGPACGGIFKFFAKQSPAESRPEPISLSAQPETDENDPAASHTPAVAVGKHRVSGFNTDWTDDFLWVQAVDGGMTCKLCIRHQQRSKKAKLGAAIWVDLPCTWMTRDSLIRHERSETHSTARCLEASRAQLTKSIETSLSSAGNLNKLARVAAFRCIYWLLKQEVPHTTNYLPLLDFCKEQGVSVVNNLHNGENDKGESMRFIQEAVLTMGDMVRRTILEELRASQWYSILLDETTDVSVAKELIIYARFLKDGKSVTEFLTVLKLTSGTAEAIVSSLLDYLRDIELPLEKMCAIGSDGASVMLGKNNGVAARLRTSIPHLLQNHCVAHRLALAVGQAATGVPYLPKFKDVLGQLHRFYQYSAVRMEGLHQIQEMYNDPILKLSQAKDVRWLSHDKATQTLKRCLPSVITSLEREAEERNDSQAMGLAVFTQNVKFIASLNMMCDVLPHMSALSKAMQTRDATYTMVRPLVCGTVALLNQLKEQLGTRYQQVSSDISSLVEKDFNIKQPSDGQLNNFTEQTYKPFLRNLTENLEARFPDLPLLENFSAFAGRDMVDEGHGNLEIKALAVHFNMDTVKTGMEWTQVKATVSASHSLQCMTADQTMEWVTTNLRESHPLIYSLASVGLLLPTSTADCERGFSALNRIKTSKRSSLSQKTLNALLTVAIQGPPLTEFSFSQAVDEWHKEKPRRTSFFK